MNALAVKTTSSIIMTAAIVAPISSTSIEFFSDSFSHHPYYKNVYIPENTQTPKIAAIENKSWIQETEALVPNITGFTREESDVYNDAINSLFEPTGRNLFDL
ncbi:hypothetical protein ACQKGI_19890 [Peribacillus muralis]|uniref:hypothetical protein n=1 Tax=Peribacillus muralis TaxID=264697 RepID=UPI00382D34B5